MKRLSADRTITRRKALRHMAAGAFAVVGVARRVSAEERPAAKGPVCVERLPSGVEIWQVTTEEFSQSNIYCEVPYCSRDSRYFVYQRRNPKLTGNRTEFMVVELGSWKQHRLDVAASLSGCAISPQGVFFYYVKKTSGGDLDLMRADLRDGSPQAVYRMKDEPWIALGTVSADGRYFVRGKRLDEAWTSFGVVLFDLKQNRHDVIDRDPFILNPHPQFEPGESKHLMIQHNRGGKYTPEGKRLRLVGPEGATLYLLSAPGGKRTTLQVGTPYTTACTGHEAWIGNTQEMLLSVSARGDYAPEKGNLLGVRAGQPARVVARGYRFNHVGVSRCGRLFCCDDWQGTYKIVIGSVATGKTAVVCESRTVPTRSQNTHPHAYLTPDLGWVIFNSTRSGFPHVHAARVPPGMIANLLKA